MKWEERNKDQDGVDSWVAIIRVATRVLEVQGVPLHFFVVSPRLKFN